MNRKHLELSRVYKEPPEVNTYNYTYKHYNSMQSNVSRPSGIKNR